MKKILLVALATVFAAGVVLAQSGPPPMRLRGSIEKVEPGSVTMRERSGELITLAVPDNTPINEVVPIAMADIKVGSFIGTAAMPQADGTQQALEVLVFPEAARGTGEGHYPWDLQPQSTMTNATVADLAAAPSGNTLKLKYKDGEKTVMVPPGIPIVTFLPGDNGLLVAGAKVLIFAQMRDGKPTALRITAGRNGFAPPM
jgi:hypothetical protein